MNIGNAIHICRIKRGLTQTELANLAGCSVSYLSMLENSKRDPTLSMLTNIAKALNIPIEILFFIGTDKSELTGINKELASQLALTALEILSETSNRKPS